MTYDNKSQSPNAEPAKINPIFAEAPAVKSMRAVQFSNDGNNGEVLTMTFADVEKAKELSSKKVIKR